MFDSIYVIKNELEIPELCLDTTTIQDFEHLVDEAHLHADSSDITQIIQYHDGVDDEITNINNLDSSLAKIDSDSLPDIALYSFDSLSSSHIKDVDFLPQTNFQEDNEAAEVKDALAENIPSSAIDIETQSLLAEPHCSIKTAAKPVKSNSSTNNTKVKQLIYLRHFILTIHILQTCTVCSKQFATNYKLNEHMRSHSTDSPFKCGHAGCSKAFRSKIGLTQHEAQHTGILRK